MTYKDTQKQYVAELFAEVVIRGAIQAGIILAVSALVVAVL